MQKSFWLKLVEDIVELRTFHPNVFNISAPGSKCLNLYGLKLRNIMLRRELMVVQTHTSVSIRTYINGKIFKIVLSV